jgi:hypothetical protein
MLNTISDFTKSILPAKRKTSPKGWISFNAPCCIHNGESADNRGRGGITITGDGKASYHCFNCKFKASYQPGRHLTFKYRKLLKWLGASETEIKRLVLEAIRVRELVSPEEVRIEKEERIEFKSRSFPADAISFSELATFYSLAGDSEDVTPHIANKLTYIYNRRINLNKYEFYVSDETSHSLHQRVLIPCVWEGKNIGYIARAVSDGVNGRYFNNYEPDFVFNINNQLKESKFVIVCEGPFDAMSVDGVAILGSDCSEKQADIIDSLGKEVIVVADADKAGTKLIEQAIDYGWSVSFPVWQETCKDINEAVQKYGKLFVLATILQSKETSKLKIELKSKGLH